MAHLGGAKTAGSGRKIRGLAIIEIGDGRTNSVGLNEWCDGGLDRPKFVGEEIVNPHARPLALWMVAEAGLEPATSPCELGRSKYIELLGPVSGSSGCRSSLLIRSYRVRVNGNFSHKTGAAGLTHRACRADARVNLPARPVQARV